MIEWVVSFDDDLYCILNKFYSGGFITSDINDTFIIKG